MSGKNTVCLAERAIHSACLHNSACSIRLQEMTLGINLHYFHYLIRDQKISSSGKKPHGYFIFIPPETSLQCGRIIFININNLPIGVLYHAQ